MAKRVWIGNAKRMEILIRDNLKCFYCGADKASGAILEVDHVIPVSKGGTNDDYNLVTSCKPCNMGKFVKTIDELEATRLKNAEEKLKDIKSVKKIKDKLYKTAQNIINLTSKTKNRTPEFQAYANYVNELGGNIAIKNERALELFIEKYWLAKTIELTECMAHMFPDKLVTAWYLQGIYNNKLEEEPNYYGKVAWQRFQSDILCLIDFDYKKNRERTEKACEEMNNKLGKKCLCVDYKYLAWDILSIYRYAKNKKFSERWLDTVLYNFFLKDIRREDDILFYIGLCLKELVEEQIDWEKLTEWLSEKEQDSIDTSYLCILPIELSYLNIIQALIENGTVRKEKNLLYI